MAGSIFDLCSSSPPTSTVTLASPPSNQQRIGLSTLSSAVCSPPRISNQKTPDVSKTESQAVPVPEQAIRGFFTAGSLVKSHHFSTQLDDENLEADETQIRRNSLQKAETGGTVPRKPRKPATKSVAGVDATGPKPKKPRARNSKASKDEHTHDAASREQAPTTSFHFANALEIGPSNEPVAPIALTKSGKPRKPRAKKDKAETRTTQTKIPKAKITKPRGATKCTEKRPLKATAVEFLHSANDIEIAVTHTNKTEIDAGTHNTQDGDSSIWNKSVSPQPNKIARPRKKPPEEALHLEDAIRRRRDWTPPRDTSAQEPFTDSAGKENNSTILHVDNCSFTNLLSNFTYAHLDTQPPIMPKPPTLESNGPTKKRRVELVDVPGNQGASKNTSPEKGKAPKKKPRTITDFVIDQYAPPKETASKSAVTGDFFEPRTNSTAARVPLNDTTAISGNKSNDKPARKRPSSKPVSENGDAKPKTKAKSKKASAKTAAKPKMVADKLLSPASALLKVSKQDVLFGTSSQLALEESPTLIRHIQQAIKESEQDAHILSGISAMSPPLWPRLGRMEGKRGLWAASARGDDGQLLEKIDNVYIPEPDRRQELPLLMDGSYDHDGDTSFADIGDLALEPISVSSDLPVPQEPLLKDASERFKVDTSNDAILDDLESFMQVPPPSNQKAESSFLDIDDFPAQPCEQSRDPASDTLQIDSSFLDIDDLLIQPSILSAITTPTGSPSKRRGRPPKTQSVMSAQPKSTTPKKPASRAKMDLVAPSSTLPKSKGRFANIEEILDSEDDEALSPTPPRIACWPDSALPLAPSMPPLRPAKTTKAAKAAKVVKAISEDVNTVKVFQVSHHMLEWVTAKSSIFPKITNAIRQLPPTTDVKNPSWHEKMVLYDAIILEDLTVFLNGNTRIRFFKRATQKQVKAWNKVLKQEGREKLRDVGNGKEDSVGLMNVVEKELEVWMVQGWCQEMSVCCINKVRGGRSGMGKGLY